jgi:hypothetical protein
MKNKKALGLKSLIGNKPILEVHFKYKGHTGKIFAKADCYYSDVALINVITHNLAVAN